MATDYITEYAYYLVPFLMDKFGIGPGTRLLDVGAGKGEYVREFCERGVDAAGIDKRAGMLTIPGDACAMPYPSRSVDVTMSKSVLEHLKEPELAVAEMFRVLVPGGLSINIVPDWWYCWRGFYAAHDHIRPFCASGLAEMMEHTGYSDVRVERLVPSTPWLKHRRWRWLITLIAWVVPYRLLGDLRFAAPRHYMILASGRKAT